LSPHLKVVLLFCVRISF